MKNKFITIANQIGVEINGPNAWDIQIHNESLYSRLFRDGSLGAGESYMDGWWDCNDLVELSFRVAKNNLLLESGLPLFVHTTRSFLLNLQNKIRARIVGECHYDLPIPLWEKMLGASMIYTNGIWQDTDDLDTAGFAKYDLVCRKLELKKGDTLLELGCGWGAFLKYAATHYGCRCTGVTISKEQAKYASELCQSLPVKIHHCDYRDRDVYNPDDIKYDAITTLGMTEHVGRKNYRQCMQIIYEQLRDCRLFLLESSGNSKESAPDMFIQKYIFPYLDMPTVGSIDKYTRDFFVLEDMQTVSVDYAKTIIAWSNNFKKYWSDFDLSENTFGGLSKNQFYRMWVYYLDCCAGVLKARTETQAWQFLFSKGHLTNGYRSVR